MPRTWKTKQFSWHDFNFYFGNHPFLIKFIYFWVQKSASSSHSTYVFSHKFIISSQQCSTKNVVVISSLTHFMNLPITSTQLLSFVKTTIFQFFFSSSFNIFVVCLLNKIFLALSVECGPSGSLYRRHFLSPIICLSSITLSLQKTKVPTCKDRR